MPDDTLPDDAVPDDALPAPADPGTVTVVLMGVSGAGKSTVADELVAATGWAFLEGDSLHPAASRALMTTGRPLDDPDRAPWLAAVAAWIGEQEDAGRNAVVTCSALRRRYRDVLRAGHPSVRFVHLAVPASALKRRLLARVGHFMPATLLASQIATLEPLQPDEPGVAVPGDRTPHQIAEAVLRLVAGRSSGRS
ncbi:MAG: gluconokinase [Pseudonocardia sp.]